MTRVLAAFLALVLFGAFAEALAAEPVRTDAGAVQGVEEGGLEVFRGIPFAAPPIGALRWREPQAPAPWAGVLKADAFKPRCMQVGPSFPYAADEPMSEDCLYLNIWKPKSGAGDKLPVMVWIYGGSFQNGSASTPFYRGDQLAKRGVIVVGINYRVGVMGFLAHPELTAESPHHVSGNYGLMDMIAALKWVQANVAAFGGDPGRVTIFGQSAGANAVNLLVASPLAKGLFQRAIGESGGELMSDLSGPSARLGGAEGQGRDLAAKLGARSLAELRALKSDKVAAAGRPGPNIDGYVVPAPAYEIFAAGRQNDVATLVGSTDGEGDNLVSDPAPAAGYVAMLRKTYPPYADGLLQLYPAGSDAEAAASQRRLQRDTGFGWEAWTWARMQSGSGQGKVWQYYFAHRPPYPDRAPFKAWGAAHTAELFYVFEHYDTDFGFGWTDAERRYGDMVASYWTNFAKTGDPNGPGLPVWPAFTDGGQTVMRFGETTAIAGDLPNRAALEQIDEDIQDFRSKTAAAK
jgi:para-nitrobenzyl esterase